MALLSSTQLSGMRVALEASLPSTCTIQRGTGGLRTAVGEGVQSWANLATGVACRLSPAAGERSQEWGARSLPVGDWILTVAYDEDVQAGDQVIAEGRTFAVVGTTEDRSWPLCRRVGLVEVRAADGD